MSINIGLPEPKGHVCVQFHLMEFPYCNIDDYHSINNKTSHELKFPSLDVFLLKHGVLSKV